MTTPPNELREIVERLLLLANFSPGNEELGAALRMKLPDLARLVAAAEEREKAIADNRDDEKCRRIYYQDIVYNVCNQLDRIFGKRPGNGIVCGTVDTPTQQVQEHMANVVRRCKEWAKTKCDNDDGDEPEMPKPTGPQLA